MAEVTSPREWWESGHPQEARCVSCSQAVLVSVRRLFRADAADCGRLIREERGRAQCVRCYISERREAHREARKRLESP